MGQIYHRNARTTEAIRLEIHQSQESIAKLAKKYRLSPPTIMKWKHRESTSDKASGPKYIHSTVLTKEEEAICVAFRKHALLPLDDCLYALQATIPNLTRSSLHRLFKRNGISVLPKDEEFQKKTQKFADYEMGFFHVDITEVHTEEGKLYLFVGIDRVSKYAYIEVHHRMRTKESTQFLRNLIKNIPYKIYRILTDNGAQFTNKQFKSKKEHEFDTICRENEILHKLTKPYHPWTNGQVERMNRTIKEATVKKYYYKDEESLKNHLKDFINAYNFGKRLKAIKGFTPVEFVAKKMGKESTEFAQELYNKNLGLDSYTS